MRSVGLWCVVNGILGPPDFCEFGGECLTSAGELCSMLVISALQFGGFGNNHISELGLSFCLLVMQLAQLTFL